MTAAAVTTASEMVNDLRGRTSALVQNGLSVADLAKRLNVARPTLSRFLNEPGYPGSPDLISQLTALLPELEDATGDVQVTADGFVLTQDAKEIAAICQLAAQNRRLAVIVGYPGVGKTSTLERYKAKQPDVVLVRVNSNMSCAGIMIRIGQQLGLDLRNGQSLDYMIDAVVKELRERPRLIIIDEADYLAIGASLRKFEILRTVLDEAQVGMVICGMPRLMVTLTASNNRKENLAQFYSRVAYMRRLVGFSEAEIRAFCRDYALTDDAFELLYKLATHPDRGAIRRLGNLLRNAHLLADGAKITLKHVKDAAAELELTRQA